MRKKIKVKIIEESLWDRLPQHVKDEINGIISYEPKEMVEVIHAEWIKDWEIGCSDCSHCGKGYLWEDYKGVADWKYCPNCGAKLDERRTDGEIH